jgi:hypothetical protein
VETTTIAGLRELLILRRLKSHDSASRYYMAVDNSMNIAYTSRFFLSLVPVNTTSDPTWRPGLSRVALGLEAQPYIPIHYYSKSV